jgi:hypothetical protein
MVVTSAGTLQGNVVDLAADDLVLGRNPGCDVVLDDPHVSRTHARLHRAGDDIVIVDLGSTSGTSVNGTRISRPFVLMNGDEVDVGGVTLRFEEANVPDPTQLLPAQDGKPVIARREARFDIDSQQARSISNVGGNQYNYVQERESFLRTIAATKTRARILVWMGLLLYVAGGSVFAVTIMRLFGVISNADASSEPDFHDIFGKQVLGVPLGLWGWATAGIGTLLLVVGIVLHIVASARRRRGESDIARRWHV